MELGGKHCEDARRQMGRADHRMETQTGWTYPHRLNAGGTEKENVEEITGGLYLVVA